MAKLFVSVEVWTATQKSTVERDCTNVMCITVGPPIRFVTRESTRKESATSVHSATAVSATPATFGDIKLIYTATERHASVRTVGKY